MRVVYIYKLLSKNEKLSKNKILTSRLFGVFSLYSLDLVGIEGFVFIDFRGAYKRLRPIWTDSVMRVIVA